MPKSLELINEELRQFQKEHGFPPNEKFTQDWFNYYTNALIYMDLDFDFAAKAVGFRNHTAFCVAAEGHPFYSEYLLPWLDKRFDELQIVAAFKTLKNGRNRYVDIMSIKIQLMKYADEKKSGEPPINIEEGV